MMRGKKNTGTHFIFKSEKFVNGIEVIVFFYYRHQWKDFYSSI